MEAKLNQEKIERKNNWLLDYSKNVTSQFGEDGIIAKIFEIIGGGDKWCVEFGAWDGKELSNTRNLIVNKGWSSVLIEADEEKYKDLVATYNDQSKVICLNKKVDFEGVNALDNILRSVSVPEFFDFLSIDIDGSDYFIWESLNLYRPKVVAIEFNPSIPADTEFVQPKDLDVNQGSLLLSIAKLAAKKGYELVAVTLANAFFARKEYFNLFGIKDNSPQAMYKDRRYQTNLFQLYDGTMVISGCKKLIWHDIKISPKDVQVLPKFLRKFPGKGNLFIFQLYKHIWRKIFRDEGDLIRILKDFIKKTPLRKPIIAVLKAARNKKEIIDWEKSDKTGPPPHLIKQKIVKEYGRKFNLDFLVETGTYTGEMVSAVKDNFKDIFSIELSDELCSQAKKKFGDFPNIHILCGDSSKILPEILKSNRKPCLFWLDAHYSGGITEKGGVETPIADELNEIFNHYIDGSVILIDDARCFNGEKDYPTLKWVRDYILSRNPSLNIIVENDVIRIYGN